MFKYNADKILTPVIIVLISLQLFTNTASAQRVNINKDYQVLEAENKVWLATPNGLFQYNSDNDSYKSFIVPENSNQAIRIMKYNDEWLWCVMDSSIAALHIRLNEWLVFDESCGLPSNHVTGIDFTDDYIYASTTNGAARYDLLIEEWESLDNDHLSGNPVNDVIVIGDKVWFITEREVSEYSPAYEKWRHFKIGVDPDLKVSMAYYYNNDIWLLSTKGLVQFNPELQSFQYHNNAFLLPGTMLEIYTEEDNNWVITPDGLYSFQYESEMWSVFEANNYLKDKKIVNGYIDDSEIWIFTDQNVQVYDRNDKNWTVIDYASGLTSTEFKSGYVNGGMVFLIADNSIEYRLSENDKWLQYEIKNYRHEGVSAGTLISNLFDNEAGGYIPIGNRKLSFEGTNVTYINDIEKKKSDDNTSTDKTSGYRLDAKSQFSLSKNRTISGFYNNIDYSETMYGARYRSKEDGDLLREYNWGDYRSEPGNVPFGETASMFGSNIWLQTGKKTEKYNRSLLAVKAQTGQKRSEKNYEYIQGALNNFEMEIDDIDYLRNQFFKIPFYDTTQVVSNIEIYVDDLLPGNNDPNTGSQTIAGITGDFDLLEATSDYYYFKKANVIRFTGYYSSTSTMVIRYQVGTQSYEDVLRAGEISTDLNNFYNLQAQSIIPYSFELEITSVDGTDVALSEFGLDDDGDGRIDKEWIDYEKGILIFPNKSPFPDGVYDNDDQVSSYVMNAKFSTKYSLVQLEFDNLVREKEKVKLDGHLAEGGTDYVLDYTNGTMVFVQDGIVTPETRIEIEYEYYLEDDYSQMNTVMVNFSPSDNVLVQADYQNFENENGETSNTIKLYSELRQKAGKTDIKITPAAVYDAEESKITAYQVEGLVSSSKVRVQSRYQKYDEAYNNIYKPQSVAGQIKENIELSTDLDVHQNVRLSGSYNDIRAFSANDITKELYDKYKTASALFHRANLPGYEISFTNNQTQTDTSSIKKTFIEQKLEYQLPQSIIDKLPIKGLKVEGFLKYGDQSGQKIAGTMEQKFLQSNFRINMNLAEQFQTSLFYRKNDFMDNSDDITRDKHVFTSERILFSLSHERWKLLQTNIRVENSVESYEYPADINYNMDLSQYAQVNFRFSPSAIWEKLSSLFFEFNVNQSLYSKANSDGGHGGYIWSFLPNETSELTNYQYLRNYYIKNEFRPNQNIYFYTLFEWNNQTTNYDLSQLHTSYWRLSEQLDAKIGFKTRLRLQYKQYFSDLGYDETLSYYEPSLWMERRWTNSFQNILYFAYRVTKDFKGDIKDYTNKWDCRYDIIFRKKKFWQMERLELQESFSAGQVETSGYNIANYYNLGSSTSLNLYPMNSFSLRFQFNVNNIINMEDSDLGYLTTATNLRLSFKF